MILFGLFLAYNLINMTLFFVVVVKIQPCRYTFDPQVQRLTIVCLQLKFCLHFWIVQVFGAIVGESGLNSGQYFCLFIVISFIIFVIR